MPPRMVRIWAVCLVSFILYGLLAIKLCYYQVVIRDQLALGAVSQRAPSFPLELARGQILDRNRIPMTDPRTRRTIIAFPQFINDPERAAAVIASVLDGRLSTNTIKNWLEIASGQHRPPVVVLGERVGEEAARRIAEARIPGVAVAPLTSRYGPRSVARHVIGYVVQVDNSGAAGIENRFDSKRGRSALRGKRPRSIAPLVTGTNSVIPGLGFHEIPPSPRFSVVLTLDVRVQRVVEGVLDVHKVEKGAVVVLDVQTGEVLAMASRPAFDQNNVAASMNDTRSPLVNRAVEPYYPGSVFKVIVAAAALEAAGVDPMLITVCQGSVDVGGGDPIKCSHHKDGPALLTLRQAMAYSCNPVFVSLAEKVGAKKIIEYARQFGISSKWNDLPEGSPGILREPDSLRGLAHLAIGQEYVRATPLEMTAALAVIARGGIYRAPQLVKEVIDQRGRVVESFEPPKPRRVIKSETALTISDWLEAAVKSGTGKAAEVETGSAGKTGTPESAQSSWLAERWDAWFVGWAPRSQPRFVIGVFVEDGLSGPGRAAPIFRDIAQRALDISRQDD